MRRYLVIIALMVVVMFPSDAFANEYLDSFASGFNDFVSPDLVEVESGQRESGLFALPSESSEFMGPISNVADAWQSIPTKYGVNSPLEFIRWCLKGHPNASASFANSSWVYIAVPMMFFWWGVRKSIKMIMKSFRKGRMDV